MRRSEVASSAEATPTESVASSTETVRLTLCIQNPGFLTIYRPLLQRLRPQARRARPLIRPTRISTRPSPRMER